MKRILIACALVLASVLPGQAQGTVMPIPLAQWFDNNGAVLTSGGICVFRAGTSTAATTYTTAALSVANTNPILFSSGRPTSGGVFLTPGSSYKFELRDYAATVGTKTCAAGIGSTIWTVDNVAAVPASNVSVDIDGTAGESIAAGNVVYLSDGSGGKNAAQWYLADADFTYASTLPQIGIAPSAIGIGATGSIRISGRSTGLSGLTPGAAYYVSATAGALTSTAPTNARFVGQADAATALVTTPDPPFLTAALTPAVAPVVDPRIKTLDNGRLSLTTGNPVTTADVTGASAVTLFWVPYKGNEIALYSGTAWVTFAQAQLSIAVPATTSTMYDVWMDYGSGTPALSVTAWTNDTTRATALTTQDGVYVKTGAATSRYLGSFRTTTVSGQTEDSFAKRYLWNYYNRVARPMRVLESTGSWTYTTNTWRQARATTTNQLDLVIGVSEDLVTARVSVQAANSTGVNVSIGVSLGLDSTTTPATGADAGVWRNGAAQETTLTAVYSGFTAEGRHTLVWLERSEATGTTTWYSTSAGFNAFGPSNYGISGTVWS